MNLPASKIEDALSHLDAVVEGNSLTLDLVWTGIIIAVAITLFVLLRRKWKDVHVPLTVISGLTIAAIYLTSSLSYIMDFDNAKDGVEEAYKSTIADNFKVTTEDMDAAEFTPTKDDTGAISEVKFGYTDKDAMAHYDLVFLFDEETNEPTLLKTGTVDSEVIESLKK